MTTARSAVAVALLALIAASGDAAAQLRLAAGGGPSYPLGTFGDSFDTGWNAQVSAGLGIPLLPVALRVDAALNRFPQADGDFQTISGSLNGIINIPSLILVPYLIGGVGVYSSRTSSDIDSDDEEETTDIGANIGGGVRLALPGVAVFLEARLHNVFAGTGDVRFAPLTFGISF